MQRIPKQRSEFKLEMLDGEVILTNASGDQLIYLNETASLIWQLCDGIRTGAELVELLHECFPESVDELSADVEATFERFANIHAIDRVVAGQGADLSGNLYTVICTDTSPYIKWQCEMLEYTWQKFRQPGELIRLVALRDGEQLPEHPHIRVMSMPYTNIDPETDDNYPPYNRLYSLQHWLDGYDPHGTVLLLDPDCVFRDCLVREVASGEPAAQRWVDYSLPALSALFPIAEVSAVNVTALQGATWPACIHTDDLRKLLPRWTELTVALRRRSLHQTSDMVAFIIASAELGIRYELSNFTAVLNYPEESVRGAPLIHYCQPVTDSKGQTIWDKFDYQPWTPLGIDPSQGSLEYTRDLLDILGEMIDYKRLA